MISPREEEGPGHVGKLPQDVGSTRLAPSSTSRKRKKSDQVSVKVDAMREKKKILNKNYYERNKEEILKKEKKNRLKMKEKRKEVSCDVTFDI